MVSKDSIDIDKDLTKDQNFEHIKHVLQAEKEQLQVSRQKSKKSFVSMSLHCWQCSAVDVSARTVRRRLLCAGLWGCVADKKPFISACNKKKRLLFARNHHNWAVDDWSRVFGSDESKFNMNVSNGAVYVRRRPG